MKTSRRVRVGLAALGIAGALVGGVALANGGGHCHEGQWKQKVGERVDGALDAAHATAPQRTLVHAALDHVFATVEDGKKDHGADLEQGIALFESDRIDPAQIEALRAEREAAMQKTGDAIVQAVSDAHDALSAPQRKVVADWVRSHKPDHFGPGKRGAGFFKHMISSRIDDALDAAKVTAEQRPIIHASRDRVFAAFEQAHQQDPGARIEKALALFEAEKIDQAQVAQLRAEHTAQARIIGDAIGQAIRDTHDALTPAQRKAIGDFVRANRPKAGPG